MSESGLHWNSGKAVRSRWNKFCRALKLRYLEFDRFSRKYRDSLNLASAIFIGLMSVFIGAMTIVFAAQANRVANSSNQVAENQTVIMEQQLRLDSGNTMPNFVVREYVDSPMGVAEEAVLWIENDGGSARYAQVAVFSTFSFYRDGGISRHVPLANAQILGYLDPREVLRDESEDAFSWKFGTRGLDAELEKYWQQVESVLASEYGITDVYASIDHVVKISYMDYQGMTHDVNFRVFIDGYSPNGDEPRLSVLRDTGEPRYTMAEIEGVGLAPLWVQASVDQDPAIRTQSVEWVASTIAENYGE